MHIGLTWLLVIGYGAKQEVGDGIAGRTRSPSKVVCSIAAVADTLTGLMVTARIPVEPSLKGVGPDNFGEVIVKSWIYLFGAKAISVKRPVQVHF